MTLTLLALFLLPIGIKLVVDPKGGHKYVKQLMKDEALMMMYGMVLMLLALLIFSTGNWSFERNWGSTLTWIGALIGLKGAWYFLWPDTLQRKFKDWMAEKNMPMFGCLNLLFALALVYIDSQLI